MTNFGEKKAEEENSDSVAWYSVVKVFLAMRFHRPTGRYYFSGKCFWLLGSSDPFVLKKLKIMFLNLSKL
jgi:hypothetical protein